MLNTGGKFVKQLHDVILTGGSPTFSKLMFKVEQSLFKFGVIILGLQPPPVSYTHLTLPTKA